MKSKQEQAQALLEALEQAEAGALRQALDTDCPEKFRALGKAKLRKRKSERPLSSLRRWGGVAACLALILLIAASPWFFSSLLPFIMPTEPTEPPTTSDATEPSEPKAPCPNLYVSSSDETITAYRVTGNWNYVWFDAWPSKDFHKSNEMPWLYTDHGANVEFDIPPDQTEVICWNIEYYGKDDYYKYEEKTSIVDGQLLTKDGTYVYEVNSTWYGDSGINSGDVTYLFTVTTGDPKYAFIEVSQDFLWPSMMYDKVNKDALQATTDNGTFYCFTDSQHVACTFVDSQQELLQYLQGHGMDTGELTYYAVDYGDSFSRSDDKEAYIDWSAVGTWQQVLVTLQAIWGDYTDYGYVYALSNQIAQQLGWKTDFVTDMDTGSLALFFQQNPCAINLLYPSFTTEYATEETVRSCKVLSKFQLAYFDWHMLLAMDLEEQLDLYFSQISAYAQQIGISYTRQNVGYAYCSARIPLKIKAANAEFYIDAGYVDGNEFFKDAFSDYAYIYETAKRLHSDITQANEDWNEIYTPDTTVIYFVSGETASIRFGSNFRVRYTEPQYGEVTYTRYLELYMYGYYKHILHQYNPSMGQIWQAHAFVELGRAKSWFTQYSYEVQFANNELSKQYFQAYAGRTYTPGLDDFFEWMDIMCYINDCFTVTYTPLGTPASMGWYLTKIYGEEVTFDLLLHPETVEGKTGKSWKTLEAEWAQQLREKYADIVLPEDAGT